uniref:CSab-Uro-3 n=1 Tax=Urodacus manicatus TaxID=1330407 RepID=T1DEJ8_UROMN
MQTQCIVLQLLVLVALCSCGGILKENYFQKGADYLASHIPIPIVKDVVKGAAKQLIHKIAKNQQLCMGVDLVQWCNKTCLATENKEGFCHGTKCKCGIKVSY